MLCPRPYRFTRIRAAHYSGVLKVDGGVGDKQTYDPRSYLKMAEGSMAQRMTQACKDLGSAGRTLAAQRGAGQWAM
jgi:fructose-bisphosphate aldolase, class II